MIHIFLNGLGASAGAGLTFLRNVVPKLSESNEVCTTVAVQPFLREKFEGLQGVSLICPAGISGAGRRFLFEQVRLPSLIRNSGADVLVSTGNFALRRCPVPQMLLSGNSLYTSTDFYRDLRSRNEYRMIGENLARGILAKQSIFWADQTIAPSNAFADELRRWTGKEIGVLNHGFDPDVFGSGQQPLSAKIDQKLRQTEGCLRLLFVSHYNYYRNFETLLRALPRIKKLLPEKNVKLFLTCELRPKANPGAYDTRPAAELVHAMGITDSVIELGAVPYESLHYLYGACDIYVSAAYAETFAHPLVEAMASSLPVVASELPVHREICREAALYFPRFSAECLADAVVRLANSPALHAQLSSAGLKRSSDFSWSNHVQQLLCIASSMCSKQTVSVSSKSFPAAGCSPPVIELAGEGAYASGRKS
jgi:glycosyltransferase involved in cell wall biosynthesis